MEPWAEKQVPPKTPATLLRPRLSRMSHRRDAPTYASDSSRKSGQVLQQWQPTGGREGHCTPRVGERQPRRKNGEWMSVELESSHGDGKTARTVEGREVCSVDDDRNEWIDRWRATRPSRENPWH